MLYAVVDRVSIVEVGIVEVEGDEGAVGRESRESIALAGDVSFSFVDSADCCRPVAFRAAVSIAANAAKTSFSVGMV